MKLHLRQWHIFTLLWLQVLSYPLVANYMDGNGIQWQGVLDDWTRFVPFFVLFLLHNFVAIPKFLLPRRFTGYFLVTATLLVLFIGGQYLQVFHKEEPPQRKEMKFETTPFPRDVRHGEETGTPPPPPRERPVEAPEPPDEPKDKGIPHFLIMDFVFAVLMLGCNIMVVLLFQNKKTREKAERLERANMQHELEYLKAQFSPHFLMNTLNNIHAMIEVEPTQAQDMVISLSKLLRYALYDGAAQSVPLSMEMAFIANYVHLRRQGYSPKKLSVSLSMPQRVPDNLLVPPLLFVVFIENAFKHGVSYRHASFVDISIKVEKGWVCFHCDNSVPPVSENKSRSGGIGLENVCKRLALLYGKNYELKMESKTSLYQVTLKIPAYDNKHTMPRD